MANLIVDGFDWFPTGLGSTARAALWGANGWYEETGGGATGGPANVTTGRFGFGNALTFGAQTNGFGSTYRRYVLPVDDLLTEGYIAFAMYYSSGMAVGATEKQAYAFYDGVNNQYQLSVVFRYNGVIEIWRGSPTSGTLLVTSTVGAFEENRWMMVEIYGNVLDSGGSCEVRINTVTKLQVTGVDTRGGTVTSTFDSIALSCHSSLGAGTMTMIIDDLYVNDTTGSTCNTWMGNLRVKTQFIIADGAINDFTIGGTSPAATNWQSVLNIALDDTKYVYSSVIGDYDLYEADPNLNAPYVRVLQVRMALKQDDATQRSAKAALRIGGVTYDDDVEHFVNQDYTFYFGKWELSPATGVSFTGTEVNGLEVGIKVES